MKITLYHSPGACSMAPYISLLEAGADFDVEIVNIKKNEQSNPDYAAINPKKKVPLLVVDGKPLTENVAIQSWIAEAFPDAKLLPSDSWDHKQAISYMGWFSSGIHPHITRHFKPAKFCAHEEAHVDLKEKSKAMLIEQLALVDNELADKTWFFDHFTACDAYFFWVFDRSLAEGFDLSELKHATVHNERVRARETVQKMLAHKAT